MQGGKYFFTALYIGTTHHIKRKTTYFCELVHPEQRLVVCLSDTCTLHTITLEKDVNTSSISILFWINTWQTKFSKSACEYDRQNIRSWLFLCGNLRQKFSEFSFDMAVIFGLLLKVINLPLYTGMLAFGKMGIISHRAVRSQHVCLLLRLSMPSEISFRSKRSTNHSGLLSSTRLWPLFNKCLTTVTLLSQSTSEWCVPIVCINFCVTQKDERTYAVTYWFCRSVEEVSQNT